MSCRFAAWVKRVQQLDDVGSLIHKLTRSVDFEQAMRTLVDLGPRRFQADQIYYWVIEHTPKGSAPESPAGRQRAWVRSRFQGRMW